MRRFVLVPPLVCLAMLAWSLYSTEPREDSVSGPADAGHSLRSLVVSTPLRYGNLSIFPVSSKIPRNQDRFITLDEGLKAGTVEIFEVGADGNRVDDAANESEGSEQSDINAEGQDQPQNHVQQLENSSLESAAEVNRLMVINRSDKPLYLMPGEVIVGGQQDRTIAQETILVSSDKPVPIDVYCVEHGRWSGRSDAEGAAVLNAFVSAEDAATGEVALNQLVQDANRGKFVASAGSLNAKGRLAAQGGEGQGRVWEEVATANAVFDTAASMIVGGADAAELGGVADTGSFTVNYIDGLMLKRLEPYIDKLHERVSKRPKTVGVIVAINGKIAAVDVFESTPLFRKLWPKLLKSYALDAVAAADDSEAKTTCTVADAESFLKESLQGNVEERTKTTGGLVVTKRTSDNAVSFSFGGGLGGAAGSGVHASAFAK